MMHYRYFDTTRNGNQSSLLTPTVVGGRCPLPSEICCRVASAIPDTLDARPAVPPWAPGDGRQFHVLFTEVAIISTHQAYIPCISKLLLQRVNSNSNLYQTQTRLSLSLSVHNTLGMGGTQNFVHGIYREKIPRYRVYRGTCFVVVVS